MYETYYDKLQIYFGEKKLQLQYMDTDSFVLSVNTKDIIKEFKNLEEYFDFSNLNENHEIYNNRIKKVFGNFKTKFLKNLWIDEVVCLRIKMYAFKGGEDSKNNFKGIPNSQSKIMRI